MLRKKPLQLGEPVPDALKGLVSRIHDLTLSALVVFDGSGLHGRHKALVDTAAARTMQSDWGQAHLVQRS